jgi:hypothetical protein
MDGGTGRRAGFCDGIGTTGVKEREREKGGGGLETGSKKKEPIARLAGVWPASRQTQTRSWMVGHLHFLSFFPHGTGAESEKTGG